MAYSRGREAMNMFEWNARGGLTRRTFVGGSAALAASSLPALAQSEAPVPKRGGMLKVSTYLNPSRLDPHTGTSIDQIVLWPMFDALVDFDQNLKPRPGLAKWSYPDPKTLVFELFPNITFHDGTSCDAEAVKWNLDRAMTFKRSVVKADLINVASIEVTGPLTVAL